MRRRHSIAIAAGAGAVAALGLAALLLWVIARPREPDYLPFAGGSWAEYRWQETGAGGEAGGGGTVRTTFGAVPPPPTDQAGLLVDMNRGDKREWFLRRRGPQGVEVRLWKVETRTPDGTSQWFRLEPPALVFRWPAEPGTSWASEPALIVDEARREPCRCSVEVLPAPEKMELAGESFTRLLCVRITYEGHLGRSVSIFTLADGEGMLREEQWKPDGGRAVTELTASGREQRPGGRPVPVRRERLSRPVSAPAGANR